MHEIKVFSCGWLDHKFGSMYLLNQNRYPHAIINTGDHNRLVVVGKFNTNKEPEQIIDIFSLGEKLDPWV